MSFDPSTIDWSDPGPQRGQLARMILVWAVGAVDRLEDAVDAGTLDALDVGKAFGEIRNALLLTGRALSPSKPTTEDVRAEVARGDRLRRARRGDPEALEDMKATHEAMLARLRVQCRELAETLRREAGE